MKQWYLMWSRWVTNCLLFLSYPLVTGLRQPTHPKGYTLPAHVSAMFIEIA